jgi:hypothetical protein
MVVLASSSAPEVPAGVALTPAARQVARRERKEVEKRMSNLEVSLKVSTEGERLLYL